MINSEMVALKCAKEQPNSVTKINPMGHEIFYYSKISLTKKSKLKLFKELFYFISSLIKNIKTKFRIIKMRMNL